MAYTIEQFATECHRIFTEDSGVAGREKIRALLATALQDEDFVAANLGDDVPARKILYEDPDFGFCILAHVYQGASGSKPHDHGPYWAIYGQGRGETYMTDWKLLEPAGENKKGKVTRGRDYTLAPGQAHLYNEGDLHSPRRDGETRLIRIEGRNLDTVRRFAYEAV
jgi:hypothetical protein